MTKQGLHERYLLAEERAQRAEQRRAAINAEYSNIESTLRVARVQVETGMRNLLHLANRRGLAASEANDAAWVAADAKRAWEDAE